MQDSDYVPRPLDTSGIELTEEQQALIESLAEHVHDEWAAGRMAEGWKLGPERSDTKKESPCFVPYHQLSESEKAVDRRTAVGAVKAIMLLGYDLVANPARMGARARETMRQHLLGQLKLQPPGTVASVWRKCQFWSSSEIGGDLLHALAKAALGKGELWVCGEVIARCKPREQKQKDAAPDPVEDAFRDELANDPKFQIIAARLLAQTGAYLKAQEILQGLKKAGNRDGETLGLLARTHKDAWYAAEARRQNAASPEEEEAAAAMAATALEACRRACEEAFDAEPGNYYPGINAATLSLVAGRTADAREFASRVLDLCRAEMETSGPNAWNLASIAEAYAVLGNDGEAERFYKDGATQPGAGLRDVCATRKQARLIADKQGWGRHRFDGCFALPPVIVYAGHRVDEPDRKAPRFAPEMVGSVSDAIGARLAEIRKGVQARFPLIAFGSAAAGSDILFSEALSRLAPAEVSLVLSSPRENFIETNATYAGPGWVERCRAQMDQAYEVIEASRHQPVRDSLSYQYAQEIMAGLACMKADFLGLDVHPIAVWDREPGDGHGGTADFVSFWKGRKNEPDIISPHNAAVQKRVEKTADQRARQRTGSKQQHLKAMLFADVRHFSRLSEAQLPRFVEKFMGAASAVIARSAHQPVVLNTWGDALYLVFDTIQDAGMLALELREALCPPPQGGADWEKAGLPPELSIRFAVHAGPVFAISDPVVRHLSFTGRHTTQTARLEPVTKPGEIFATQEFAALAHLQGVHGFACVYLGRTDLDKGYRKNEPIYQVVQHSAGVS